MLFYRLFCKIVNLWNIDLKFFGSISDVNIDNPAKFVEVNRSRSCMSKNCVFQDFVLYFTDQTSYVKILSEELFEKTDAINRLFIVILQFHILCYLANIAATFNQRNM